MTWRNINWPVLRPGAGRATVVVMSTTMMVHRDVRGHKSYGPLVIVEVYGI